MTRLQPALLAQRACPHSLGTFRLVKDTRTGHETADVSAVLDGDLEPFMTSYLRHKSRQEAEERLSAVA